MLIPYPNLINSRFYYYNYLYKVTIEYQGNNLLHLLSLLRVFYFGYFLITMSKHWSSSAQRIA